MEEPREKQATSSRLRNCSWNRRFGLFFVLVFSSQFPDLILGGNCWLTINRNGKCSSLVQLNISQDECCNHGPLAHSYAAAYSDETLNPSSIFIMHIQGGVRCRPCKESCQNVNCSENKKCAIRNGKPKCICAPNCSAYIRLQNGQLEPRSPVCGTDGQSYKNPCRLLKRSCRKKLFITVAYTGPCKASCKKMNCPGTKQCLLDQNLIPHCVNCLRKKCPLPDPKNTTDSIICGTDGLTYDSVCELRQASCRNGKAIPVAYNGPCKKRATCETVQCSEGQTCLQELKSSKPRCVTCSRERWCRKFQRHQTTGPICGSNNETYKNWCEMMDDACRIGIALDTKHTGPCRPHHYPKTTASNSLQKK